MEHHFSKRIKGESGSSASHQQLVGSNLIDDNTSSDNCSSLNKKKPLSNLASNDRDLDFETLRWTPIFVDKSMLIQCIMEDDRRILFTAPPRFGKTMAKNMLQIFFEVSDSEQKSKKYKIFKDLKIYKCSEKCPDNHDCEHKNNFWEHCGEHPVISLDFGKLNTDTYKELLGSFRRMITFLFEKYKYLIHKDAEKKYTWSSKHMEDLDINIKRFERYLAPTEEDNYWRTAEDGDKKQYIFGAFTYLIHVLSAYHQTKQTGKLIIVLVDEFDTPFMKMLSAGDNLDKRVITLIQDLMRLLCKEEESAELVGWVVIFSVTALGGMISLGANNVRQRTFLDEKRSYWKFFGFTKKEVEGLVESNVEESQRQVVLNEIAAWYNNYTIIGHKDITIYNPCSITQYLPGRIRENYWVETVGTKHVCELLKFEKIREKLFPAVRDDHNISISTTKIHLNDISNLKKLNESLRNCINDNEVDLALQFLAECGYFNVIKKEESNWTLQIPNQELKETFRDKLYHALLDSKTNPFDVNKCEAFLNALESLGCGKEHEPMKYVTFRKSVENLYSNRKSLPKAHFHFHCDLWKLIHDSGKFVCFAELPIRTGRSPKLDVILITKNGTAILIEVKRHEQDSAEKGLKQCLKKEYYKAFQLEEYREKIVNTILMGLHLSNEGKVSIRYLENFKSEILADEHNRKALINGIVQGSYKCSDSASDM